MFILPVAKDNQTKNVPWVVIGLICTNTLILILTYLAGQEKVFAQYAFIPAQRQVWTSLSSMFLHAGVWHLLGNMFFLWMFGVQVENMFGPWLFGLVYLACGFGGDLAHYMMNLRSTIPTVGASGAVSGIVGIYFILFPKANFDLEIYLGWAHLKTIPTHTHAAVGAWIGEQAVFGVLTQLAHFSSVAFWAHVGGFGVGVFTARLFVLVVPQRERHKRYRAKPWFMQDRFNRDESEITQLKL
jgi:membrane associated rhomboid family serine protease